MTIDKAAYLRKCLNYRNSQNRFGNLIGIVTTEIDDGYAKGYIDVTEKLRNPIGSVHGGCLYSLADSIGGAASASHGYITPTVSGDMHFLSPALNCKRVWAEARELKHGKKMSTFDVRLTDENSRILATAIFTYYNIGIPLENVFEQVECECEKPDED
ncbi:MAG: PaaI family thioesterase [Eubacterium sp.]|nr:PaaI family thioesterase [Eubacterium sp.]